MTEVAVVGAGVSGLSLAWQLRRLGVRARVFESADRPGGKIRSESLDGFLCEWGPAGFSTHSPVVQGLLRALGLEGELLRASGAPRRGVLVERAGGANVVSVPQSIGGFLQSGLLSPREKLRALSDLARLPPRRPAETSIGEEESLAELAERHLGRAGAERLLYPTLPGAYALDPQRTSVAAAFPWLHEAAGVGGSLLRAAPAILERADASLASFTGGMELLPRALAAALGDDLQLSTSLRQLDRQSSGFRLSLENAGALAELDAGVVILALPAHAASPLLAAFDSGLSGPLASIPYAPVTLAFLGLAAPVPERLQGHGYFVPPGSSSALAGAVFASTLFTGRAPEGRALVTARFGGARHPELAALPDEALSAMARKEVAAVARVKDQAQTLTVVRHPQALPQYTLGHRRRLAEIEARERRHPGLFLAGNAYRGLGVADCLQQSAVVAERVASYCARVEALPPVRPE